MSHVPAAHPPVGNRRRCARVPLAVPVALGTAAHDPITPRVYYPAESIDLSPNSLSLILRAPIHVNPGEFLSVSVAIPLDARRAFPFSRLSGLCRIVRVEPESTEQGTATKLALAFFEEHMTRLGAT